MKEKNMEKRIKKTGSGYKLNRREKEKNLVLKDCVGLRGKKRRERGSLR